jgi:hypothetical protein
VAQYELGRNFSFPRRGSFSTLAVSLLAGFLISWDKFPGDVRKSVTSSSATNYLDGIKSGPQSGGSYSPEVTPRDGRIGVPKLLAQRN